MFKNQCFTCGPKDTPEPVFHDQMYFLFADKIDPDRTVDVHTQNMRHGISPRIADEIPAIPSDMTFPHAKCPDDTPCQSNQYPGGNSLAGALHIFFSRRRFGFCAGRRSVHLYLPAPPKNPEMQNIPRICRRPYHLEYTTPIHADNSAPAINFQAKNRKKQPRCQPQKNKQNDSENHLSSLRLQRCFHPLTCALTYIRKRYD